jgi:hypothetical protein
MNRQRVHLVKPFWHEGQMALTLVVEFKEKTPIILKGKDEMSQLT